MVKGGLFSCIPLAVFMAALFLQFKSLFIKKKKDLVIQKKTTLLQIHTNEGLFYFSLFFFFFWKQKMTNYMRTKVLSPYIAVCTWKPISGLGFPFECFQLVNVIIENFEF